MVRKINKLEEYVEKMLVLFHKLAFIPIGILLIILVICIYLA